jgi:DNA polymerase theta
VVESCLVEGGRGMERAVLEVVASKAVASAQDMKRYVQCTLLAATQNFQARPRGFETLPPPLLL